MSADLAAAIEQAWENRAEVTPASKDVGEAVEAALALLDSGKARVAEPDGAGGWTVNQWLKKAVLLSFRLNDNAVVAGGAAGAPAFDKVPSKFDGWDADAWADALDPMFDEYGDDAIGITGAARSPRLVEMAEQVDGNARQWAVRQVLDDPDGDRAWHIRAIVDLDASDEAGEVVLHITEVGSL